MTTDTLILKKIIGLERNLQEIKADFIRVKMPKIRGMYSERSLLKEIRRTRKKNWNLTFLNQKSQCRYFAGSY